MKVPFQAAEPQPLHTSRTRAARHFPRAGRVLSVALLLALSWAGLALFIGAGLQLWRKDDIFWGWVALGGLALIAMGRSGAFLLGSALHCSLCHGPVLHEKKCRKHADALRLAPLSHRTSTALSLLLTGLFRCMYCGTAYRIKK